MTSATKVHESKEKNVTSVTKDENVTNVRDRFEDLVKGIKIMDRAELSLLGAPLFPEAINTILNPKLENLKLMARRLNEIDNHEALFLLRHCFAMPKLTYFLRTSPCFLEQETLENFDKIIKDTLVNILNISLPDMAYNQATLPISKGGLGLRLATEIAVRFFIKCLCNKVQGKKSITYKCNKCDKCLLGFSLCEMETTHISNHSTRKSNISV